MMGGRLKRGVLPRPVVVWPPVCGHRAGPSLLIVSGEVPYCHSPRALPYVRCPFHRITARTPRPIAPGLVATLCNRAVATDATPLMHNLMLWRVDGRRCAGIEKPVRAAVRYPSRPHIRGLVPASDVTKEYKSSWIFEPHLTCSNALRRVQNPGFSLVTERGWCVAAAAIEQP